MKRSTAALLSILSAALVLAPSPLRAEPAGELQTAPSSAYAALLILGTNTLCWAYLSPQLGAFFANTGGGGPPSEKSSSAGLLPLAGPFLADAGPRSTRGWSYVLGAMQIGGTAMLAAAMFLPEESREATSRDFFFEAGLASFTAGYLMPLTTALSGASLDLSPLGHGELASALIPFAAPITYAREKNVPLALFAGALQYTGAIAMIASYAMEIEKERVRRDGGDFAFTVVPFATEDSKGLSFSGEF